MTHTGECSPLPIGGNAIFNKEMASIHFHNNSVPEQGNSPKSPRTDFLNRQAVGTHKFLRIRTSTQLGRGLDSQRFIFSKQPVYVRGMVLVLPIPPGNRIRQFASANL